MASQSILSKELEDELRQGVSGEELVILSDKKKKNKKNAAKQKKSELEKALETYKPRPEKAVQSLKKDQRMAEEVKAYLKEQKRVNILKEKQEQDAARRSKREELFVRLQKSALPPTSRDDLQTSSKLSKPIASIERQEGKIGERQRREKSKRKNKHGEEGKTSKVFVAMHESSSDDASSFSEDEAPSNAEEEDHKDKDADVSVEEEIGLLIAPTPPPPNPVFKSDVEDKQKSDLKAANKVIEQVVSASKRSRTNSTASNRSDKSISKALESVIATSDPAPLPAEEMLVVRPNRPQGLAESRAMLPVCGMEQEIMEAVKNHRVVFVCGETGSGKTTQVPQFLLEAGFGCTQSNQFGGMVCVSQPRRVAAVSVAERVAQELGCPIVRNLVRVKSRGNRSGTEAADLKGSVGYQIRHDTDTVVEDCTRIKFCTDGILLRECREDFLLRKYSCIVLDEVHERGLNSDLLLGMLSRIVPLRESMSKQKDSTIKPLRLILMSATLDVADFSRLGFGSTCPVVRIETRQHPVVPHFSKRTEQVDYLGATLKKVCRVHEKLPPGSVLVFLPGQREIEWMCRQLKERYNDLDVGDGDEEKEEYSKASIQSIELVELGEEENSDNDDDVDGNDNNEIMEERSKEHGKTPNQSLRLAHSKQKSRKGEVQPAKKITRTETPKADPIASMEQPEEFSDLEDDDDEEEANESHPNGQQSMPKAQRPESKEKALDLKPVHIVPLYSRLSSARQRQAFQPSSDPDARVIVVATNIAETSLTIPGIRYVVDSGRERRRDYDQRTGTSSFKVEWISQQSAKQRMGRAGRTGPGHCYRLYSAAVFSDVFAEKTPPEMQLVPVDDLVLYMKSLGIDRVAEFPFPSQLDHGAVVAASDRLKKLGLLSTEDKDGRITKLGIAVSKLPLSFRLGKQLVVGTADEKLHSIRTHLVCLAAVMSLPSPFDSSAPANAHQSFRGDGSSDTLALLRAAGAFSYDQSDAFCARFGLNIKTMNELKQLYSQLARTVAKNKEQQAADIPRELPRLRPLSVLEETFVKQTVVSVLLDRIARKMDAPKARAMAKANSAVFPPRHVHDWPYEPCDDSFPPALTFHAKSFLLPPPSSSTEEDLKDFSRLPEYIVFSSVDDKGRMEGVTACDPTWLRSLAQGTRVCSDAVCDTPEPCYDAKQDLCYVYVKPQLGDKKWSLPIEKVPVERIQSGDTSDVAKYAVRAFARALLEGKIAGKFLEESESAAPFAQCTRPVLQPRVANLVGKLLKYGIVNRKQLMFRWREDPTFLKAEIVDWVRVDGKKRFEDEWSSKLRKAVATS